MMIKKNYYNILEVDKGANQETIRKAYHNLIKIYHPDSNFEKDVNDKYEEINEAYVILSNPDKKQEYDQQFSRIDDKNSADQDLVDIIKNNNDIYIIEKTISKITDENILIDLIRNIDDINIRKLIIDKITDETILADIVKNSDDIDIIEKTISKITDENILVNLIRNIDDINIRKLIIDKITDETILADIVKNSDDIDIIEKTISKINNVNILEYIIMVNAKYKDVSNLALKVILKIKENENDKIIERYKKDMRIFENHKEKEINEIIESANKELILKITNIYENFKRALDNSDVDEKSLKNGLKLIYSQLKNTLEKEGLKEISTEGEKFDVDKHEVLSIENNPDYEDGYIIEELSKGYIFNDKVIKYSKVKVNKCDNKK
jgi:molecular chaperone GrpE